MALAFAVPANGTGTDTTTLQAFTTGSISFVAGRSYVIACAATGASAATPTVAGVGTGSWSAIVPTSVSFNPTAGPASRLNCFTVTPVANVTETLAITYAADRTVAGWGVVEITGQNSAGLVVQGDSANSDAVTSVQGMTNNAMSLATFTDAVNNGLLMFVALESGTGVTAAGGLAELFDIQGSTPNLRLAGYWQIGEDTTPDATFASADGAALAFEIKAAASSGGGSSSRARINAIRRRRRS